MCNCMSYARCLPRQRRSTHLKGDHQRLVVAKTGHNREGALQPLAARAGRHRHRHLTTWLETPRRGAERDQRRAIDGAGKPYPGERILALVGQLERDAALTGAGHLQRTQRGTQIDA